MESGLSWKLWSSCVPLTIVLACFMLASLPANGHEEHIADAKQIQLEDVCGNQQVPIVSVKVAKQLIREVELDHEMKLCENRYRSAFFELKAVLDEDHDVCGDLKFKRIKDFHFRYIRPPLEEVFNEGADLNNLEKRVKFGTTVDEHPSTYNVQLDKYLQELWCPEALKVFFKAYALQINGLCKRTFGKNLDKAMQKLDDDDHVFFDANVIGAPGSEKITQTKSSLDKEKLNKEERAKSDETSDDDEGQDKDKDANSKEDAVGYQIMPELRVTTKYDYDLAYRYLVYMPDLEGEKEEGDLKRMDEVTRIDLRDNPEINKFMHACEKHFKPIYNKLIMPIVRLAKLGYEYCGPEIDDQAKALESEEAMIWMSLTMACEQHGKIELVGDEFKDMREIVYNPLFSFTVGDLWIKGAEAVRDELIRTNGYTSKGFERFLFDAARTGRKFMGAIDPQKSTFYRRNQNTIGSGLNVVSILSNVASMALTIISG